MSDLFSSFDLSGLKLANRVVMAPLTRSRAPEEIPTEQSALYYAQRATAGLIVSEGSPISYEARGNLYTPGLFRPEQVEAWHAAGIANGGTTCEDPPGLRDGAVGRLYLAYLRDPDGNKLCGLHRPPAA